MNKTDYFALLTNILEVNGSWRENFSAAGIQAVLGELDEEDFFECCIWDNLDEERKEQLDEEEAQGWTAEFIWEDFGKWIEPELEADEISDYWVSQVRSAFENSVGLYRLREVLDEGLLPKGLTAALKAQDDDYWND